MELVYLWVEKYKNIEKQGFNFSSKYRCEFKAKYKNGELDEENSKLKNSKLIIKENKDCVNLFPKNINITAIVGKNGAGKSNLLEVLKYWQCWEVSDINKKVYKCFALFYNEREGFFCIRILMKNFKFFKLNLKIIKNK